LDRDEEAECGGWLSEEEGREVEGGKEVEERDGGALSRVIDNVGWEETGGGEEKSKKKESKTKGVVGVVNRHERA
jgi:hypothetical protein